jgi:hypothetical protein
MRAHFHAGGINDSGVVCQGEGTAVFTTQQSALCFVSFALKGVED